MSVLKPWLMAARPKTLTAAFIPILVVTLLAWRDRENIDWMLSVYAFFSAILIQIGTNLINDAIDFKKGADTSERLGFTRVTQIGLLTPQQVLSGGMIAFAFALALGVPLIVQGGWPVSCLLAVSVLLGYGYTGGPYPLAYHGLGDLFVLIFFGFAATGFVYYILVGEWSMLSLLLGAQIGLLATVIIAINNLRDVVGDTKANKRTLPVRFGVPFAKKEIAYLLFIPFILNFFWFFQEMPWAGALPFLCFPLAWQIYQKIQATEPSREYNSFFGKAALLHLVFGVLLGIGFLL